MSGDRSERTDKGDTSGRPAARKGYHKLVVWKEAHQLVLAVYDVSKTFPRSEIFGLTAQMRSAAISVASNIVEGQARGTSSEFRRFLNMANGSLAELEYQLELAHDLGWIMQETYQQLDAQRFRVGYLLNSLMRSLGNS